MVISAITTNVRRELQAHRLSHLHTIIFDSTGAIYIAFTVNCERFQTIASNALATLQKMFVPILALR